MAPSEAADGGRDIPADTTGPAVPPPPSRCEGSGLPICLDFESGAIDAGWTVVQQPRPRSAEVMVDDTRPARGARSLHIKAPGKVERYLTTKALPEGPVLHVRFFLFLSAVPAAHGSLVRANGVNTKGRPATYEAGIHVGRLAGSYIEPNPLVEYVTECNPAYANGKCPPEVPLVQPGRWSCIEAALDGKTRRATRVKRDGVTMPLVVYYDPWPAMERFETLDVGLSMYHPTSPVELWIDELAVDVKPIGCDR